MEGRRVMREVGKILIGFCLGASTPCSVASVDMNVIDGSWLGLVGERNITSMSRNSPLPPSLPPSLPHPGTSRAW